jgi:two-component system sensor histidine kinase MprB
MSGIRAPHDTAQTAELRELLHEVRNAVTSVSGHAQLALRRLPTDADPRLRRALEAVRDGVKRVGRLVEPAPPEWQGTQNEFPALVTRAASQLPPERYPDLVVHERTEVPLLGRWDGDRITQVIANLLDNAAKYSPPGSPIEVEIACVADQGQGWALVTVRDQGIGVRPEELRAIFLGYRTVGARRMAKGGGLGLQLSRRIVEDEGGRIGALGAPGHGSVFYVRLPLAACGTTSGAVGDPASQWRDQDGQGHDLLWDGSRHRDAPARPVRQGKRQR